MLGKAVQPMAIMGSSTQAKSTLSHQNEYLNLNPQGRFVSDEEDENINKQKEKLKPKFRKLWICTYNCRSLWSKASFDDLIMENKEIKWDIIGLSEMRRKDEGLVVLQNGHLF
jgi:hypothetical protein